MQCMHANARVAPAPTYLPRSPVRRAVVVQAPPPAPAPRRVDPTINIGVRRQIRYAKMWKEYERQMVSTSLRSRDADPGRQSFGHPCRCWRPNRSRGWGPMQHQPLQPAPPALLLPSKGGGARRSAAPAWRAGMGRGSNRLAALPPLLPCADPGVSAEGPPAPGLSQGLAGAGGAPQVRPCSPPSTPAVWPSSQRCASEAGPGLRAG